MDLAQRPWHSVLLTVQMYLWTQSKHNLDVFRSEPPSGDKFQFVIVRNAEVLARTKSRFTVASKETVITPQYKN